MACQQRESFCRTATERSLLDAPSFTFQKALKMSQTLPLEQSLTQRLIKRHISSHDIDDEQTYGKKSSAKAMMSNVGLAFDLGLTLMSSVLRTLPISKHLLGPPSESEAVINSLIAQQKVAVSYDEWKELSLKLDTLLGNQKWKQNPVSDLYDYELITLRLNQLRYTRTRKDYKKLLYLIRTTWTRNIGNIGNVNLYRHSLVGTKNLIEDYLEECELSINCLIDESVITGLDDRYILGMLIQTRKAIGRTALVLSGGGCFGLFHIGVLSTLLEQDLLPKIVSGSSAGAIVASILSVHTPEEVDELLAEVLNKEFMIFSDSEENRIKEKRSKQSVFVNVLRFLRTGNFFDSSYLIQTMKSFLGSLTFREAYNRTGRILNVTVSPASFHEQPRLLNYITAPNVLIWSAVCASCALPGVFPSTIIYEKDSINGKIREWNHISVKFVDGSVDNDLPITRLSEMFNVDHIIACQVNPHVAPFLKLSLTCVGGEIEHELSAKVKSYFNSIYKQATSEIIHYLDISQELGIARNMSKKLKSILTQKYSGDITILPDLRITELDKVLKNPTPQFILDAAVRGARSTWPKLGLIHNHCFVEFLLDKAISRVRSKLISNKVNMTGISLALVNSPVDSDSNHSEDDMFVKETLFGEAVKEPKRNSTALLHRQRSESLTSTFGTTRSVSHGNIRGSSGPNFLKRHGSVSALRHLKSRDTMSASDAENPTNTILKYYSSKTTSSPSSLSTNLPTLSLRQENNDKNNFTLAMSSAPAPTKPSFEQTMLRRKTKEPKWISLNDLQPVSPHSGLEYTNAKDDTYKGSIRGKDAGESPTRTLKKFSIQKAVQDADLKKKNSKQDSHNADTKNE